jgi:hypothetical protein
MNRVKKNTGKHSIYNGQKKIKYLGINSTKEVKDIYNDKYTSLKKEIKEDIKVRTTSHTYGPAESILQKCLN